MRLQLFQIRYTKTVMQIALVAILVSTLVLFATVQPFVTPIRTVAPKVSAEKLAEHVKKLSVDFYPRSSDQFEKTDQAADYIAAELRNTGARVVVQEVIVQEIRYKNIIAQFGSTGASSQQAEVIVVGAHYDSHGDASAGAMTIKGYSRQTHTPGADDNASGVAGLIELARLLSQAKTQRQVELVAYCTEEPPHFRTEHMGSAWHAKQLQQQKRPIALMIALEMIGYFDDKKGSQSYPLPGMSLIYPASGNFIAIVNRMADFGLTRKVKALMAGATELPVHSINTTPLIPGVDFSDHLSYWANDIPAVMVTDTAFMRNPHYHQAGDTHDKLDYVRMAQVVQGVFAVVQHY
jgi:Zn-dependent M28 family amino/carboxypeptidase